MLLRCGNPFVVAPLLPIEPPEADAPFLHRTELRVEPSGHKLFVARIPGDILVLRGVHAHPFRHLRVELLVMFDTVGRVQIERGMQPLIAQPLQKSLRRGKQPAVPGISRPSAFAPSV